MKRHQPPGPSASAAAPSLHQHILETIVGHILSGHWPVGHRIASEHELAASFGCSRMTVSKAMTHLAQQGLVERRRRAGTFVRRSQSSSAVLDIPDIGTEVASLGLPYRYEILHAHQRRRTGSDASLLSPAAPGQILELMVLHHAGPRPFCLEERLISLGQVPDVTVGTFDADPPGTWLARNVPWTAAEHRIQAGGADPPTARRLKIRRNAPCLMIDRRTWSSERPVTYVRLTYPGDAHQLIARFSPATAALSATAGATPTIKW